MTTARTDLDRSLFNWATSWHQGWVQRLIGAWDASLAAKTIIVMSTSHDYSTLSMREVEYNRYISVRTPFLWVNQVRSVVGEPTINRAVLRLNGQYREVSQSRKTIYKSAQLRLHSFQLSNVHQLQLACTPTALTTSKNTTCTGIRRPLSPMEEDQPKIEALLPRRISARAKCIFGQDTPQWEVFPQWKRTYSGYTSPSVKCIHGRDLHISTDRLWWLWWLWWLLRAQLFWTIEVHLPTVSHTVHELCVRDVHGERQCIRALIDCGAISLFMAPRLLRQLGQPSELATLGLDTQMWCRRKIVGKQQSCVCLYVLMILYSLWLEYDMLPASSWHPDSVGDLVCHQNRPP